MRRYHFTLDSQSPSGLKPIGYGTPQPLYAFVSTIHTLLLFVAMVYTGKHDFKEHHTDANHKPKCDTLMQELQVACHAKLPTDVHAALCSHTSKPSFAHVHQGCTVEGHCDCPTDTKSSPAHCATEPPSTANASAPATPTQETQCYTFPRKMTLCLTEEM